MTRILVRGVAWQGVVSLSSRATRWASLFVLAALLSPEDFGRFAAMLVVVDMLHLVQGLGLEEGFVVRRERWEDSADSTFLLTLGASVVMVTAAWFAAPLVESFYGLTGLAGSFRLLSLTLIAHALRAVPIRLVERSLQFHRKLIPTLAGSLAYAAVTIVLAWRGWGVDALVLGLLIAGFVESLGYWLGTAWRPRWVFSRSIAREDLRFGIPVMAGLLLNVAYQGLDRIVLGRMAGAAVLGPYSFGQSLTTMPLQAGTMAVSGVLLPVYGRVRDASERIQLHLRSVSLVAGSGFLLLLLALVAGGDALLAIYGDKWERAASLLGVLGVAAVLRSLATLTADYLMGIGRADGFRAVRLTQLVVAAAAILPAYRTAGVVGVAWAMAAAAASGLVVGWLRIRTSTRVPIGRLVRAYRGPTLSLLLVMPVAMLLLAGLSDPARPSSVLLAAGVTALAYVLAWYALDPQLRDTVRGRGPGRKDREAGS